MIPNQDEHGIRYTMYSMNDIDSDLVDDLLYTYGKDLSYEAAYEEEEACQRAEWENNCETSSILAQENFDVIPVFADFEADFKDFVPMIDEPVIEGTHQGIHYRTSWLGGAQMLWVFKSPIIGHFNLCSTCVPGACDGSAPTPRADGFCGYAVPPDWLADAPAAIDWCGDLS